MLLSPCWGPNLSRNPRLVSSLNLKPRAFLSPNWWMAWQNEASLTRTKGVTRAVRISMRSNTQVKKVFSLMSYRKSSIACSMRLRKTKKLLRMNSLRSKMISPRKKSLTLSLRSIALPRPCSNPSPSLSEFQRLIPSPPRNSSLHPSLYLSLSPSPSLHPSLNLNLNLNLNPNHALPTNIPQHHASTTLLVVPKIALVRRPYPTRGRLAPSLPNAAVESSARLSPHSNLKPRSKIHHNSFQAPPPALSKSLLSAKLRSLPLRPR